MEKKVYKRIKTEILSINLSYGKIGGIRKKIQGRATKAEIERFNQIAEEWRFNSRDEMFNAVLDLTLRYCAPLPTDEMINSDVLFLFDKLIDRELFFNGIDIPTNKDREELKLYFLFMLQPFSDERIKKEDYRKMEKNKKRFNYGKTIYQVLNFIISTSFTLTRSYGKKNDDRITINESFNDIRSDMKEMDTTKSKYTI